jgi:hypothetical protein
MSAIRIDRRKWLQAGCNDFILTPFGIPVSRLCRLDYPN